MHRSSKRIVTPLLLLLVGAAIFVPEVRGDELLIFNEGNGTWIWTLPQDAVPDQGSVAAGDFAFLQVPVQTTILGPMHTFDVHFFFLCGGQSCSTTNGPLTTGFILACDPFRIVEDPINLTCDYENLLETNGDAHVWLADPGNRVHFIPGDYFFGTISVATPEPSTLALLLMSFATIFLLAVGVRPSHR